MNHLVGYVLLALGAAVGFVVGYGDQKWDWKGALTASALLAAFLVPLALVVLS